MIFGSVCSGIEAASVAWHPIGWTTEFVSEIEPFPSAVLAHHYPDTPNYGDMTKFEEWPDATIDVLVGGTPCQSFSVAGLRKGLDDPRGSLMLTFGAIARRYRPTWLVWENVPGVLSSNGGRDFGTFLGMLGELGYGFSYRVLDAQYFGVAQRRRRVFVVGCLGNWRRAAAVLFERHSLSGNPPPSRESRKVAPTIPARSTAGGGLGTDFDCDGGLIQAFGGNNQSGPIDVATARNACASASGRMDFEPETFLVQPAHTLRGEGFDASEDGTGRGTPLVPVGVTIHGTDPTVQKVASLDETAQCLRARTPGNIDNSSTTVVMQPVSFAIQAGALRTNPLSGPDGIGVQADHAYTLEARAEVQAVAVALRGREGGATAELGDEVQNCLRASSGGGDKPHVLAPAVRDISQTLTSNYGKQVDSSDTALGPNVVFPAMQVRRLTPRECERLQGFPDDYTRIPWKVGYWSADKHAPEVRAAIAEQCPDGPRYKALGNSMAVPVMRWIGERIQEVAA